MRAVAAEGVWKFYGDYPALRDVILHAGPGECLALIGRNGAGKTTLLRIIAGFSKAGRGQVRIFGNDPRETETRRRMGFIGHGISVYDELSAFENLKLYGQLTVCPIRKNPRWNGSNAPAWNASKTDSSASFPAACASA